MEGLEQSGKDEEGLFQRKITNETENFSSKYLKELPILTQP